MIVCEFCMQYRPDGKCKLNLDLPKGMSCLEFDPGLEKFCSDPKDFVSSRQLVEIAMFFSIKGRELKKVRLMAAREESSLL